MEKGADMIALLNGDARAIPLPDQSVHCAITSPPYWGLRDYNVPGQIGLEPTPELYVSNIVACMHEVWRVLRDDGTLWLVLGDSYAQAEQRHRNKQGSTTLRESGNGSGEMWAIGTAQVGRKMKHGLKPKDLVGIPWRVAFALQADGWYLRSAAPWVKRSSMPESVTDRPASSLEYVFLLAKQPRYYFDMEAVKRRSSGDWTGKGGSLLSATGWATSAGRNDDHRKNGTRQDGFTRNWRNGDLWFDSVGMLLADDGEILGFDVSPHAYSGAHFAAFPPDLVEPMVLAGTSARGCCPKCGAPWVRIVERDKRELRYESAHVPGNTSTKVDSTGWTNGHPRTIGWRPSCDCDAGDSVPCTVLEPFAGTATVGRVCAQHGRHFIGMELNPAYIELARARTSGVQMEMQA